MLNVPYSTWTYENGAITLTSPSGKVEETFPITPFYYTILGAVPVCDWVNAFCAKYPELKHKKYILCDTTFVSEIGVCYNIPQFVCVLNNYQRFAYHAKQPHHRTQATVNEALNILKEIRDILKDKTT